MRHLEITEVVLFHCNIGNNYYQHNLRVLYTFAPNKLFGQLLDISPYKFMFLKTFDSEFTDRNSKPLDIFFSIKKKKKER